MPGPSIVHTDYNEHLKVMARIKIFSSMWKDELEMNKWGRKINGVR